jgi:L-fuconolactonase
MGSTSRLNVPLAKAGQAGTIAMKARKREDNMMEESKAALMRRRYGQFALIPSWGWPGKDGSFENRISGICWKAAPVRLSYRNPMRILVAFLLLVVCAWGDDFRLPEVKQIIDTHIHLYDPSRENGVPWPPKDDAVLYRPHLPTEFKTVSRPAGLTGVVVVEASDRPEDNRWVLDLIEGDDYFVALVGNIDPYEDDFGKRLRELAKDPRFVGIRLRNGRQRKAIDYRDEKLIASVREVGRAGLAVDLLVNGGGVAAVESVDRLARAVPGVRLVVDHVLGYDFDGKAVPPEWAAAVRKLGENRNVWCKVSGLYQRSIPQPAPQTIGHYEEVLDLLWEHLGPERLLYGSNWPCTKKSGDYESYVRLVNQYFSQKGREASERYFWRNAVEVYRLKKFQKGATEENRPVRGE